MQDYQLFINLLLFAVGVLILGIFWIIYKTKQNNKKAREETKEAITALMENFAKIREETKKEIANLDSKPELSEEEKKIYDNLKETIDISEKYINKEIEDIEKELK